MSETIYQGSLGEPDDVCKILPPHLDIDAYLPVEDPDNYWNIVQTRLRRNGETIVMRMHWSIHGQVDSNGKRAWLLGDNNPMLLVISKDEDGIQHHADLQQKGKEKSESFAPAWTSITNKVGFRQKMSMPYLITEADGTQIPAFLETQMTGYETIKTPAGIFQNCIRVDTYYKRVTGTVFNSVVHFCAGVGLVRYKFRQINTLNNSIIVVGAMELENARVNGKLYGNPS